jgi:hypothetical protein
MSGVELADWGGKRSRFEFVGLDIETSGGPYQKPGEKPTFQVYQPIQIGLARLADDPYYGAAGSVPEWMSSLIGYAYGKLAWNPKAAEVHKIPREAILLADSPARVDQKLVEWLDEHKIGKVVPVGFAVTNFDMPFVREYLPEFSKRVSMRGVDLNAIVFALSAVTGMGFDSIKNAAKEYAQRMIAQNTSNTMQAHDAGYDALQAIYAFEFFRRGIVFREIHGHLNHERTGDL